jgi:transposase
LLQEGVKTKPYAHHVILWDAAGFHQKPETGRLETERLEWSGLKHVHVITLPAYTPELNPVEKLWDQLKDTVCNWVFDTIEQTRGALKPEMQEYWQSPQKIFSLLGDNWLRQKTNSGYRVILPLFN